MKRGFLNTSKAKARPLGPANTTPGFQPPKSLKLTTHFPFGKVGKIHVPLPADYDTSVKYRECDGRSGTLEEDTMTYTTIPWGAGPDEPVSECFFYPGSKEVLMKLPGFPQPLITPATPAFRLVPVAGKGSGLVSTRALQLGDLVINERPLFVCARGVPVQAFAHLSHAQYLQHAMDQLEKYCEVGIQRMRPEDKESFMALVNSHKEDGSGPIVGRVRTNGLWLAGLRPGVEDETNEYSSVCAWISRLNHSCSPNCAPRFDMASFSYRLYALRDIADGEELTFQYTDVRQPAAQRNAGLQPYDFGCDCAACKDAPASDARRKKIEAFSSSAARLFDAALADDTRMDKFLAQCREQLALIAQEGVEHFLVYFDVVKMLMEAHIWRKDAQGASEWAEKLNRLRWDESWVDMSKYLDPASPAYQEHPLWRKDDGTFGGKPRTMQETLQQMAAKAGKGHAQIVPGAGAIFF